jgi:adenylate kinase
MEKRDEGKLDDSVVVELLRKKLGSWECQNQGYVLDGYPVNTPQAETLFPASSDDQDSAPLSIPEFVVVLEATDELLKNRVWNMDESKMVEQGYDGSFFLKSLAAYREANTEDKSVLNFFEEREQILPILLQASSTIDQLMEELTKSIGAPHNFGPSVEELEAKKKKQQEEEAEKKRKQESEKQQQETQEKVDRDKREHEWAARIAKLEKEERDVLELQSAPFRSYLMENIMPTLTNGLIELCKVRPQDPVDYLAEYLFRHSVEE